VGVTAAGAPEGGTDAAEGTRLAAGVTGRTGSAVGAAGAFDQATAVRRTADGRYDMQPDPRFSPAAPSGDFQPAVNGGVLIAAMLRAVLDTSPHPHPVATSANFLRVPRIAPAQVAVNWLKQGKTAAVARTSLLQDDQLMIESTVATGSLAADARDPALPGAALSEAALSETMHAAQALSWTAEPPSLPPVDECVPVEAGGGIRGQVDLRLDPATAGWMRRSPAGIPEMRGYFRLRDDRPPDAYLLAFAVDALPPVVFGLGAFGWAPTVELTWYMRAVPADGLLRVAARCRHVGGGWFDEEAEVWDSAGRLVAQSRQIARVGR
jgi:acyl-coenzyme A thioesterase PaaI-like protein